MYKRETKWCWIRRTIILCALAMVVMIVFGFLQALIQYNERRSAFDTQCLRFAVNRGRVTLIEVDGVIVHKCRKIKA